MEDLQEVTRQYMNCPIEAEARRQRVLHSDTQWQMEETVDRILSAAVASYQAMHSSPPPQETAAAIRTTQPVSNLASLRAENNEAADQPEEAQEENNYAEKKTTLHRTNRRKVKPARLRSTGTSPLTLHGACSRKRDFTRGQRSPGRKSPANDTTITNTQQDGNQRNVAGPSSLTNQPNIRIIPAISKKKKDFHVPQHPAP
ncbi:unnamed protein product [Brassica rapa subsp. narinosa]